MGGQGKNPLPGLPHALGAGVNLSDNSLSKQEDAARGSSKLRAALSEVKVAKDNTCFAREVPDSKLI